MSKPKVLMLGDSITHGTDWAERLPFFEVTNRAVPGYNTDDLIVQLAGIDLTSFDVISLLIGTNDFGDPRYDRAGDDLGQRVCAITAQMAASSGPAQLIVHSILPRSLHFSDRIHVANGIIKSSLPEAAIYLDCWPALSSENFLRPEFLLEDGFDVHLNEAGYNAWQSILEPVLMNVIESH